MEGTRSYEQFSFDGGGLIPPPERLRKVLVVGAGVAGLQAARQMLKLGAQVLILEANDEVGGVWIRNYIGFGLQVPWRMYQFPEFPWPKDLQPSSEYPTGQEVQEYVRAYCRNYDLRRYIHFNCKLLRLRWCNANRQWDALYCDTFQEKFFKVTVDYAIICAGIYSQPYIPDYEGTDTYAGIQLHAKEFIDLSLARGRRVVIVGAGKTALDCVSSIVATNTATSVTLLYRQAHWPLPRRMLGTSVRRLLFNRAMTTMMPPYYTAGSMTAVASKLTAPFRRLFWRGMESIISRKFRITEQMRPRVHLPADLFYGGQILDNTMDKLVRNEALITIKGEINRFVRNGVILQDGNFVAADLVLYCTGYLKTYDYLEGEMRSRLDLQKDGLYLYRNCLPYSVPHLAFIGSEVSTYNNILTHGLQALWLAHVLSGCISLPSPVAMAEDVRAQQRWRRAAMPAQRSRGSVLMLYMMHYHDQLLADMGKARRRKGFNLFAECFGAYTAADYKQLLTEDNTVLPGRLAEEQLAVAGLPPAVLAAGRAITGAGVEHRVSTNGNSGTAGVVPRGSTGAAAAAINGMFRAHMTPNNPPLDDRFFGSSSRAVTSASARSCNGHDYQTEQGVTATAAGAVVAASLARGSGIGAYGMASEMTVGGAAARAFPPKNSMDAASTGRILQGDWNPDSVDSPNNRAAHNAVPMRRAAATVSGTRGAMPMTAPADTNSMPKWARNEEHRRSARVISTRLSADMAVVGRWGDGGGGSSYSDSSPVIPRRPKTATLALVSTLPSRGVSHVAAALDPPDPDSRPPSRGLAFPVPLPPGRGISTAASINGNRDASGEGSGGGGRGSSFASAPTPSPHPAGGERSAGTAAVIPAVGRRSFTARSQRDFAGAVAPGLTLVMGGSSSGSSAAATAVGTACYPAPSSPSRLSRHTGPTSPIPSNSAHTHMTRGIISSMGQGDYLGPLPIQHAASNQPHPQQHVRWSLLSGHDEAGDFANCGGSGSGVALRLQGGSARQIRSHYSVRSAPDNAPSATTCDSGMLLRDGSSGDVSGGSCEEECYQPSSVGLTHRHYEQQAPNASQGLAGRTAALVQRYHVVSPTGRSQGSSSNSTCLPLGIQRTQGLRSNVTGEPQREVLSGSGGGGSSGGGAGPSLRGHEQEMADGGPEASATDSGGDSTHGGGGVDSVLKGLSISACTVDGDGNATGAVVGAKSPTTDRFQPAEVVTGLSSNQMSDHCNHTNINSSLVLESSSDQSPRLGSCSRSRSSADSNPSCNYSSDSASATETGAVLVTRGSGAGAGGRAIQKVHPINESPGAFIMAGSPEAAVEPQQIVPSGAPVWHASISDCRPHICGSIGGASEGVYGSPGSSAVSLSLWHAIPVVASGSGFVRQGHGAAARVAGATESRFGTMGRLVEAEQADDRTEELKDELEESFAPGRNPGPNSTVAAISTATATVAAAPAGGAATTVADGFAVGAMLRGGRSGPSLPVAGPLSRAGSSIVKSPLRGSVAGAIHLIGNLSGCDWRRAGSLGRSTDGMSPMIGEGSGMGAGGGSWNLLAAATSSGAQSTGSSGWQIYPCVSLAGGLAPGGSSSGVPIGGAAPELVLRQPSRLSSCPTDDSMTTATFDAYMAKETPAAGEPNIANVDIDVVAMKLDPAGGADGDGDGGPCHRL